MLSDNIRNYRKSNNMSQDELAEKLEVTRQSISLWETGQTQPSLDNIVALAKIFNITTDDLLTEDKSQTTVAVATNMTSDKPKKKYALIVCIIVIALLLTALLLWKIGVFNANNNATNYTDVEITSNLPETNEKDLYGYFKDFVVQNGTINGDYCYYSKSADNYGGDAAEKFSLYYWGDTDTVEFCLHRVIDDTFSVNYYLRVPKNDTGKYEYIASHYYRDNGEPLYEARGTITASEFTKNYPLNCTEYIGSTDKQNDFMETSRQGICKLISCLEKFAQVEKLEYSFSDFGFNKF